MALSPDSHFAHRYVLEGELGRGGMGRVVLALDSERDHRPVALKLLRVEHPTAENMEALGREFELMTRLSHPNLVEVFDYAVHPECFFSMEYVEGRDLRATLLTDDEIADVMVQICRALEYIHSRGLVHLDIKPSNVLITRAGALLHVKLMDFGVSTFSRDGSLRGYTVGYVAPEVLEGRDFDGRADLFALGMTIGLVRHGHDGNDDATATQPVSTTHEGYQRSALPPRNYDLLPAWLRPIIERLVRREPSERFASAAQVIDAIALATGREIPTETAATRAGYLAAARLAGRAREWRELATAWQTATLEHAQAVRIRGRSGVGKSRLTSELRLEAQLRGALVVESHAAPDEAQSYSVARRWVQALAPLCRGRLAPEVERELQRFGADDRQRGPSEWTTAALGNRLLDAILTAVAEASRQKSLLLVVEDEQWIDAASAHLLDRLRVAIAEGQMGKLLLLVTERTDRTDIAPLATQRSDERCITLGPLQESESRLLLESLLQGTLPDAATERIIAAADGSSLYLCEVLRWLADCDLLRRADDGWSLDEPRLACTPLPSDPESLIAARLQTLPEAHRDLLGKAAMLGEVFLPTVLEDVATGGQVRVALLELTARTFLVAEGRRLRFAHALQRQAAARHHEARPGARRLNGLLADELAAHQGHPADVARLLLRSDAPWRAMPSLRRAAQLARALFDYHAAAQLLASALELVADHGDELAGRSELELALFVEWLEALRRAGRPDPVDKQRVLGIAACSAPLHEGTVRLELAELLLARGGYEEATAEARLAVERLAPAPPKIRAAARRIMGLGLYHQGRLREAIDELCAAVALAEESGDALALSAALNDRGFVYGYTGDYRRAVDDHTAALAVQQRLPDSEEVRYARAATENNLGFAYWSLGRYDLGRRHLGEALHLRRLIRDRHGETTTLNNLGNVARHVGQLDEAARWYEAAIQLGRATGNALYEAIAQNNLGQLHDERGEHLLAEALYRSALATVRRLGDRIREGDNLGSLGACLLSRGERGAACAALEEAAAVRRAIGDRAYLAIDLSFLARARAEEADEERARQAIADVELLLRDIGEGIEQVQLVHWNLALAHRAIGQHEAAARARDEARRVVERLASALGDHERPAFLGQRLHRHILEDR